MTQMTSAPAPVPATAQAWRFSAGAFEIAEDMFASRPDDDLDAVLERQGYRRYMDFCDRQFEVWEKNYRFVFIVSCSGFDYWTVELEGCPDYLEFMTRYFIPLLRYEEMCAAEVEAHRIKDEPPPPDPSTITDDGWRRRMAHWRDKATWSPRWGPPPGKPGCLVPDHIVAEPGAEA